MTLLETARLRLRQFTSNDANSLYALDHDPEVMRCLGSVTPPSIERIRSVVIPRFLDYHQTSCEVGFFAAEDLRSSQFIGWFHLRPIADNKPCFDSAWDDANDLELGYRLRSERWGSGLATEGALALVERALNRLNIPAVSAYTLHGHKASIRVMEKAGLEFSIQRHCSFLNAEIVKHRRVRC